MSESERDLCHSAASRNGKNEQDFDIGAVRMLQGTTSNLDAAEPIAALFRQHISSCQSSRFAL